VKETIQERIARLLKNSGRTLSAAESCTGGQISHLITTVSGSSSYYLGSVTSYAIPVKEKVLGVPGEIIRQHGVVSSEVAAAMAEGVRRLTGSTFAVSTTGLAEGGDERYPEGTVWIGVTGPAGTITKKYHCDLGRKGNIRRFATTALRFLASYIENNTTK
jgi:nicotinamide-nucleotide amidase